MGKDTHYNAALHGRLCALVRAGNLAGLTHSLGRMSHAQYRQAGYMLGEMIGPGMARDDFWALLTALVRHDAKAFLVTMLKSAAEGMARGTRSVRDEGFAGACQCLSRSATDSQKTVRTLLPVLGNVGDIRHLFGLLGYCEMSQWIPLLLQALHPATAFVLLQALHYVEHDRAYLLRVAQHLVRNGDTLSFNLASLIRTIYNLDELRGTFSLRLEPFQLSRIEQSYEAFEQMVTMK